MKLAIFVLLGLFVFASEALMNAQHFRSWAVKHGKKYADEAEEVYRFGVFKQNLEKIAELNRRSEDATFAVNKFADLTAEEFSRQYKGLNLQERETPLPQHPMDNVSVQAPTKFDWRTKNVISSVKDQGQCGSCWAFATTEEIESVCMLKNGQSAPSFAPLSPQQIVDCDTVDEGCNGGDPVNAYQYVEQAGGLNTASQYPYTARDGSCRFQRSSAKCPIRTFQQVSGSESQMASVLSSTAPMAICIDAEPWQFYNGGVLRASSCGNNVDHAVQLVGYDLTGTVPYWIVRNSWGTDWGMNGYIHLQYGANTCDITYEVTYPVAA